MTAFLLTGFLCLACLAGWEIVFWKKRRAFMRSIEEQDRLFNEYMKRCEEALRVYKEIVKR